jgi:hypothetical protein
MDKKYMWLLAGILVGVYVVPKLPFKLPAT